MKQFYFIILLCTYFAVDASSQNNKTVVLKGKVHNRPIDSLFLIPSHHDIRTADPLRIPIQKDNSFYYELRFNELIEYTLIFKSEYYNGAWQPIEFFPDNDTINFELHSPENFKSLKIHPSQLTNYRNSIDDQMAKHVKANQCGWYDQEYFRMQHKLLKDKPNFAGFSMYIKDLIYNEFDPIMEADFLEYHEFWKQHFNNHSLMTIADNLMSAQFSVHPGKRAIDFKMKKIDGTIYSLSELITQSDYTLLDLWAPWCGPCIRKSRAVETEYKILSKNGMQIVNIVGGVDSIEKCERAIETHNYPWSSYVEVNNENQIWEKYGVSKAGGIQVLFDKEQNILAVNPTVEEIMAEVVN